MVCKIKVIFLLLLFVVFFVLMEGKGQTYTKETLPDYSEVRVQAFICCCFHYQNHVLGKLKGDAWFQTTGAQQPDSMRCTPGKDVCDGLRGQ